MDDSNYESFLKDVKKVKKKRNCSITNSYGIYDGFLFYRKNKPKGSKYILTSSQYRSITRKINNYLRDGFSKGEDIVFPARMGRLELRKFIIEKTIENGKVKFNSEIDWKRTLRLWYDDIESYNDKTLVRTEDPNRFRIYYNKKLAIYKNKYYYTFNPNRQLKIMLKNNIKENKIDAFTFK